MKGEKRERGRERKRKNEEKGLERGGERSVRERLGKRERVEGRKREREESKSQVLKTTSTCYFQLLQKATHNDDSQCNTQ